MTSSVLLPDGLLLGLLVLVVILAWLRHSLRFMVGLMLAVGLAALFVAALWPEDLLRAAPGADWQRKARDADRAVIFGFGLGEAPPGRLAAGDSNRFLLDWAVKSSSASCIVVQEGVWAAACDCFAESCAYQGRRLVRMHRHVKGIRVDTLEAAWCASETLRIEGARRVVVVAHDLQLLQAAWDLRRVLGERGLNIEIVIPDLPHTPFPGNWVQLQASSRYIYKPVALFWARPRDFLRRLPAECPAPCGRTCTPVL